MYNPEAIQRHPEAKTLTGDSNLPVSCLFFQGHGAVFRNPARLYVQGTKSWILALNGKYLNNSK